MSSLDQRLETGLAAVRAAGAHALDLFKRRDELVVEKKGKQDLVSRADRECETIIREHLSKAFPEDGFLGEEYGTEGNQDSLWVIDPIDGTSNYLHGIPYWGILLAYVRDGRTLLGFTFDPCHDDLWHAVAGQGAFKNGRPIHVSDVASPEQALLALSYNFKYAPERYTRMLERSLRLGIDHRRIGSSALKLAAVADGSFDACISMLTNSWDVLPGLLLVKEAGGCIVDFAAGGPLTTPRSSAACAPGLKAVIEEITELQLDG